MACFSGPEITNNGLVLHLDAANPRSYSGSGTAWKDLSGNGNNATLMNSVGYNSASNGNMAIDGINDHCLLPTNFFNYPSLSTFTINLWFKSTQIMGGTIFAQQTTSNPSSGNSGWVPVIYLLATGILRVEPFWTGSTGNFISSTVSLNNGIWHNVTVTFSSGTVILYIDGAFSSQRTGLALTSYTTTYYYILGAGYMDSGRASGTNYFNGNISNFGFYNRALTVAEVKQNFEATRGRYGI